MDNYRNYLIMDGKSSLDFNMYISGGGTYLSPEKVYEEVEIPGRSGTLIFEEGESGQTYKNVTVSYEAFIFPNFDENFTKLKSFLMTREGYFRLEDTYHVNEYRLASLQSVLEPEMAQNLYTGLFTIEFNCKPQRWLKTGEKTYSYSTKSILKNETNHIAKPLIRAYGTGNFTINGRNIKITSANSYTDIDCELMDAYKGTTNCNSNITLTNGAFPVLSPGENEISMASISQLQITPRWYVL